MWNLLVCLMNKLCENVCLPERHAVSLLVLKRSVYACFDLCALISLHIAINECTVKPIHMNLFLFLKLSLIVNSIVSTLFNQIVKFLICFIDFNVSESWSACSEMVFLNINWEMICHKMMISFVFPFCFKIQKDLLSVEAPVTNTGSTWIPSLWVTPEFIQYILKSEEPNGFIYEFV